MHGCFSHCLNCTTGKTSRNLSHMFFYSTWNMQHLHSSLWMFSICDLKLNLWSLIILGTFSYWLNHLWVLFQKDEMFAYYCLLRSSRLEVFWKKGVLRNFAKFTGKHLCQSLFFNNVAGLKNTFFTEHLWVTSSRAFFVQCVKALLLRFFRLFFGSISLQEYRKGFFWIAFLDYQITIPEIF